MKSGSRRMRAGAVVRRARRRRARRFRAGAQDRAAQVRWLVAAADAVHPGVSSGADRRQAAPGSASARPRFIRRCGCRDRLKYLAGSEIGAGVFTADTVPEEKVKELQAVAVDIDATCEASTFGAPDARRRAGRVNLIGEHTDYHEGFVLPTVIPQRTRVELGRATDRRVRASSREMPGERRSRVRRSAPKPPHAAGSTTCKA